VGATVVPLGAVGGTAFVVVRGGGGNVPLDGAASLDSETDTVPDNVAWWCAGGGDGGDGGGSVLLELDAVSVKDSEALRVSVAGTQV